MYEIAWGKIFHEKGDDLGPNCQGIRCRNLIIAKENIFGENLYRQGGKTEFRRISGFHTFRQICRKSAAAKHSHNFDVFQSILIILFM